MEKIKKLESLMDKGWFRIVLFLAFGVFSIVVACIFAILGNYISLTGGEEGYMFLMYAIGYPTLILMYYVCDVINNSKHSVTKFIRRLLMIISLIVYLFLLICACCIFIQDFNEGNIKNAFFAGWGFAPLITYPLVYFFLAGRFQNNVSKRTQFILLLGANILPILLGFIIMLILRGVNNSTTTKIVLIGFIVLIILAFIVRIKKHGFFVDDINYSSSSSTSDYSSSDYSSDDNDYDSAVRNMETMASWRYKLSQAIINSGGRNYMTVSCDTRVSDSVIYLDVTIDVSYVAKTMPDMLEHEYEVMCKEVERAWRNAARDCPYDSELNFGQPIY